MDTDKMKKGWFPEDEEDAQDEEAVNELAFSDEGLIIDEEDDTSTLVSDLIGMQDEYSGPQRGPDGVWRQ